MDEAEQTLDQELEQQMLGAPVQAGADHAERLLAELNDAQREAVTHGDGPLLVLAGAGSGKTRVLTHRIAWLLATGRARPTEILAITFTNKAAEEMRERVSQLVGGVSRAMWVTTFHSACARILRADAQRLGYKRAFTIYDEADSLRMIKRCMEENELDPKRYPPRAIKAAISAAKNQLTDSIEYGEASGSSFEEAVADTYRLYERRMVEASAMDFDDLLVRTVNLLELFEDVREKYRRIFRHVLVDEYQDTNRAQYRLLQLLAEEHRNLTVVGDDFQCLPEGTAVTMGDGTEKPIERLRVGDEVLSAFGAGTFAPASITETFASRGRRGVAITTRSRRRLESTPEHLHFAGYGFSSVAEYGRRGVMTVTLGTPTGPLDDPGVVGASTRRPAHGEAMALAVRASARSGVGIRFEGTFAADGRSLPCTPAASVCPGMAMFTADGGYDTVVSVEEIVLEVPVYDINVERTHNFVANGLVTHNSVYSFRGADIRNILEFERDFPDAHTVLLEQNYRSTQTILDAANGLIAHNENQKRKHLWTDGSSGEKIVVAELDDEHVEARYVASEINRLVEEGTRRDEIAVFYRMNAQSRVLEDTLVRFEIPYQVIGGTKFYDRAEIKDAVAYLSLLANPADAVSFTRVVNSPRRGIGNTTQARLLSHANTLGEDIWDVFMKPAGVPGLGSAALKAVNRFADSMAMLREKLERTESVAELLESVLRVSGYIEALEAERTVEAEGRIENLEELVGVAGEFDANRALEGDQDATPLEEFLAQIRLISEQDNLKEEESLATLMSLHNAKGLEYEAVFVIGCEEGVFPHSRSVEEGNLEEERRLAYVGVTRARERLWLSYARRRMLHGSSSWNLPSRFLKELPQDLVDSYSAVSATGWPGGGGSRSWGSDSPRDLALGGSRRPGDGFAAPERKQPVVPETAYSVGDDVVHASFGEGVVTAVEPGSVVVVRFAGEGGERKLMADYAPIKRVA